MAFRFVHGSSVVQIGVAMITLRSWHWQQGLLSTARTAGHDDNSSVRDVVTNTIML